MVDPDNLRLALISAAVLGFRHGLDYDHIAAITDISSVQAKARDAMRFGLLYVAGHATTVAVLGSAAMVVSAVVCRRPAIAGRSDWSGITLLVLGLYVLGTFFRPSTHSHGPRTRITLLINGTLWIYWRLSRIFGGTRVEAPQVFKDGYGTRSTFLVGVIHGLGAETPTQIAAVSDGGESGRDGGGIARTADVHCRATGDEYADVRIGGGIVFGDSGAARTRCARSRWSRRLTALWWERSFCLDAADKLPSLTG